MLWALPEDDTLSWKKFVLFHLINLKYAQLAQMTQLTELKFSLERRLSNLRVNLYILN